MKWQLLSRWLIAAGFGLALLAGNFAQADSVDRSADRKSRHEAKSDKGGKNSLAENLYPNSTRKEHEDKWSPKLGKLASKGIDAFNKPDYAVAETTFQSILDDAKASPFEKAFANQILGSIAYERDEDGKKAITFNAAAIALDGLPNASQFALMQANAQLYLQEDQFDQAITMADRFLKESGVQKALMYAVKGQAYYMQENYPLVVENLKQAIALAEKPNNNWNALLIQSYAESEQPAEAIAFAESVLASNPDDKNIIRQLSNLYIDAEQQPKALALMDRAYSSGLLKTEAELRQLAQLYAVAEQVAKGAQIVEEALAKGIMKANLASYSLLANIYAQGEDSVKTAAAYGKAAEFAPDGDMKFQQAYWLYAADQPEAARAAALEALKRVPFKQEGECWLTLGNSELALDHKAAAVAAFEKAAQFPSTKKNAESWLRSNRRN